MLNGSGHFLISVNSLRYTSKLLLKITLICYKKYHFLFLGKESVINYLIKLYDKAFFNVILRPKMDQYKKVFHVKNFGLHGDSNPQPS